MQGKKVFLKGVIPVIAIGTLTAFGFNFVPQTLAASTENASVVNQSVKIQDVLDQTMKLASEGKVINGEKFGLGSKKKDIQKKWGKPQYQDEFTSDYTKRKVTFSFTNESVDLVSTQDQRLLTLTHDQVEKTLGKPIDSDIGAGQIRELYQVGKNVVEFHWTNMTKPNGELELVSVEVKKGEPSKKINKHIQYTIVQKKLDVTGDKVKDIVTLIGQKEYPQDGWNEKLYLSVQDGKNQKEMKLEVGEGGYEPSINFGDFNQDQVTDIHLTVLSGATGQSPIENYYFAVKDGKLSEIK